MIDTQVRETRAVRYRCAARGRTFPAQGGEGVSRYRQSRRLTGLAVLIWTLGVSERGASHVLHALGTGIHRSPPQADPSRSPAGGRAPEERVRPARSACWERTRRAGVSGHAQLVGFVMDEESGKTVGVDVLAQQVCLAHVRKWVAQRLLHLERLVGVTAAASAGHRPHRALASFGLSPG